MSIKQVNFKYIQKEGYLPVYVNGAIGGKSTKNEVVLNFYQELPILPTSQTYSISENGGLGAKVGDSLPHTEDEFTVNRFITTGIVLSEAEAQGLYNYLGRVLGKSNNTNDEE